MTEYTTGNEKKLSEKNALDNVAFVNDDGEIGIPDNLGKTNEKEKKKKDPKNDLPPVNFLKLFQYADKLDIFYMTIGVIGAIITGLSTPANTLIFGDLTNALIGKGRNDYVNQTNQTLFDTPIEPLPDDDFTQSVNDFAMYNSIIGAVLLVFSYISVMCFCQSAQRQIFRIRTMYFRSALL